jgi:hypothetical protein
MSEENNQHNEGFTNNNPKTDNNKDNQQKILDFYKDQCNKSKDKEYHVQCALSFIELDALQKKGDINFEAFLKNTSDEAKIEVDNAINKYTKCMEVTHAIGEFTKTLEPDKNDKVLSDILQLQNTLICMSNYDKDVDKINGQQEEETTKNIFTVY